MQIVLAAARDVNSLFSLMRVNKHLHDIITSQELLISRLAADLHYPLSLKYEHPLHMSKCFWLGPSPTPEPNYYWLIQVQHREDCISSLLRLCAAVPQADSIDITWNDDASVDELREGLMLLWYIQDNDEDENVAFVDNLDVNRLSALTSILMACISAAEHYRGGFLSTLNDGGYSTRRHQTRRYIVNSYLLWGPWFILDFITSRQVQDADIAVDWILRREHWDEAEWAGTNELPIDVLGRALLANDWPEPFLPQVAPSTAAVATYASDEAMDAFFGAFASLL
ncbi:MAG: hypothetical protein M1833_007156 [Piccolia ochrophora]|nr:MAG: hypothetical protein M1833_007156 [Piccolia ochrophora]